MKQKFKIITSIFAILMSVGLQAQTLIINTVAGKGTAGYGSDGIEATMAELNNPYGVVVDDSGKIYISDKGNNAIRRVNKGIISRLAGSGVAGYGGDGGPATIAKLNSPDGIAFDTGKNIYIADYNNNVIRKVNAKGIIFTVAGNNTLGFMGDGAAATMAELSSPTAVAVDAAGNLYIADEGNNRIRKVDITGTITTIAGNGSGVYTGDGIAATTAGLNTPSGVAVDGSGNIFVVVQGDNRICMINTSGIITTVAGNGGIGGYTGDGGPATNAELDFPESVSVDGFDNLFIADRNNNTIRKVSSGIITTVAGNDSAGYNGDNRAATTAMLYNPHTAVVDTSGRIFIADGANNRIRMVAKRNTTAVGGIAAISSNIAVFPNPNNGIFTVKASLNSPGNESIELVVMNIMGQVIYKKTIIPQAGNINEQVILNSDLPGGVYLLKTESPMGSNSIHFILRK